MQFWGAKSKHTQYGALIDVASGSIGIAVVSSHAADPFPKILYSERIQLRISENQHDIRRIHESLLTASLELSQQGLQALLSVDSNASITKLLITCSSPWAYTIAKNVQYVEKKPFKVTKLLISDLVHKTENEISAEIANQTSGDKQNFTIVERATVDMTVNDYKIANPFGQYANSVGLSHIAGFIPEKLLHELEEVQQKILPSAEIRVHTSMLVVYCVMRDIFPSIHSSCIIDMTGEAVEFGVIENNLLAENSFIPTGVNTLVKRIAAAKSGALADIQSALSQFTSDTGETVYVSEIEKFIDEVSTKLKHISEQRLLPQTLIVSSQTRYLDLIKYVVKKAVSKVSDKKHTIITLDGKIFTNLSLNSQNDVYLGLGARFFHKIHGCGDMDGAE